MCIDKWCKPDGAKKRFKLDKCANCEDDIDTFVHVIESESLSDLQSQSPGPNIVVVDHTYYIPQVIDGDVEMIPNTREMPANILYIHRG